MFLIPQVRMAAGVALAIAYETVTDDDNSDNALTAQVDALLPRLNELAQDSDRFRAKRDLRIQRSIFRDIVKYFEVRFIICVLASLMRHCMFVFAKISHKSCFRRVKRRAHQRTSVVLALSGRPGRAARCTRPWRGHSAAGCQCWRHTVPCCELHWSCPTSSSMRRPTVLLRTTLRKRIRQGRIKSYNGYVPTQVSIATYYYFVSKKYTLRFMPGSLYL